MDDRLNEITMEIAGLAHDACWEFGPYRTLLILSAVMRVLIHIEMDNGDTKEVREMYAMCEEILKKKPGEEPGQPS